MDISARVTVLERVPLFNGLKPEEREAVAREAHERPLKKGDVLFQQGEEAAHNHVRGWGGVRLAQTKPGGQNRAPGLTGSGDLSVNVEGIRQRPIPGSPNACEDTQPTAWKTQQRAGKGSGVHA